MTERTAPGRPRSFDADAALRAAMSAFRAGGFTGTSYDDLETATKLRRQSLIYAFGDKRAMFHKALALYAEERVGEIVGILERDGPPLANVEAVFDAWLGDVGRGTRDGCLMVNTSGELGRSDLDVAAAIARATARLRDAFEAAFERARAAGDLGALPAPRDLASLAVAAGDGALLQARTSGDAAEAVRAFRALLGLLR